MQARTTRAVSARTDLLAHCTRATDAPALEAPARTLTWRELDAHSERVARALALHGVRPGDRVACFAHNSVEHVLAFLATWRMGAVWVPINPGYQRGELDHVLDDATPILTLVDAPLAHRPSLPLLSLLAHADDTAPATPNVPPADDPSGDDETALLIYTSGTTGKSKGCMLSARNVVEATSSLMAAWGVGAHDTLVHALPLFHVHGLCVALCGALMTGARVRLLERFSPAAVADALTQGGTVFMGVPTMYRRLLDDSGPAVAPALARARLLCSGSAPLPAGDFEDLLARTGQRVVERYGMSETLITCTNPLDGARKPGTVGRPLPGVSVRIVDDELWVKGPGVMSGYWNNAQATAEAFADGWLKTGDAARIDDDGYVTILGRTATDFVKVGGYKVSTREVEDALRSHPLVDDVAVVGVPDREWGERIIACVVARGPAPSLESLAAHVALANHKHPRGLLVVDELPRNAMGKVQKRALAQQAATHT